MPEDNRRLVYMLAVFAVFWYLMSVILARALDRAQDNVAMLKRANSRLALDLFFAIDVRDNGRDDRDRERDA